MDRDDDMVLVGEERKTATDESRETSEERSTLETAHEQPKIDTSTQKNQTSEQGQPVRENSHASNVLCIVAIVTIIQGLCFFAASLFGGSVPFLPRDPLTLIGVMYTMMGFGFILVSKFCRGFQIGCHINMKSKHCGHQNITEAQTASADTSNSKKND